MLRHIKNVFYNRNRYITGHKVNIHNYKINLSVHKDNPDKNEKVSTRMSEFRKKLKQTTPIKDLGDQAEFQAAKDDPLPPFPNNTNPETGEIGGPRGPEPTRYGDWERKGRVTDF